MKKSFQFFSLTIAFLFVISNISFADGLNSIHTSDGVYVIAAGEQGNILRSLNGGNTWAKYTEPSVNFKSVFTLGTNVWFSADNGKVYKASTSSNTLTPYSTGVSSSVNSIFFIDANNGFICGENGVVSKSVDGGLAWNPSNTGITGTVNLNSIHFKDSQNGVVVGNNGSVYVTINGGTSWTQETIASTRNLLDVKYFTDGIAVVGEWGTGFSKPNGSGWIQATTKTNSDIRGITGTSMTDIHICGGGGFVRNNRTSSDAFIKYDNFEKNPMLANLVDIVYSGSNIGFAVSNLNNAIIRTVNGGTSWQLPAGAQVQYNWQVKPGASGNFLGNNLCLHPTHRDEIFIAFGNQVYRSLNRAETWGPIGNTIPSGNTPHSFYVSPLDTNIWMVAIQSNPDDKIYRSTNYGQSWTEVLSMDFTSYGQPLEMDQNNPHVFYFAPDGGGFYKSTNDGATFTEISNNYPFRSPCDLLVSWDNSNEIFLADGTTGSGLATLFKSTNGGVNWTLVHTNGSSSEIPSMSNTVFDKSLVWATEWPGSTVYKSTNYGSTFFVNHSNGNTSGWGSDICKEDPTLIITGSWGANAFLSLNGGANWTNISSGLSGHGGGILVPARDYVLCHQGSNVYKLNVVYTVITSVSENIISSVPKDFNLSQNYPNPFNPETIINYQLSMFNFVSLKVYDILGNEVATLVNQKQNSGYYSVVWNGANYSSGIYFYKLTANDFTETKKMILSK